MKTNISQQLLDTRQGREANDILRACVHCGFCTATCPTYQLLGDELDSPRGRIYLIKEILEGQKPTIETQKHLDRCLTCRSCESTCPSGVQYGRLVDIGRDIVEKNVSRSLLDNAKRNLLNKIIPNPKLFRPLLMIGRLAKPILPSSIKRKIPIPQQTKNNWPAASHTRKMLILDGCVQPTLAPNINVATARVLDSLGITVLRVSEAGCCGAVTHHLNKQEEAISHIKRNIDAWWPHIESGAECIVITASGCGTMLKDYGHLLTDDPEYAERAKKISEISKDIVEILNTEGDKLNPLLSKLKKNPSKTISFHSPCSLQHGQQIKGATEAILERAGFKLTNVTDPHLCCGSAGTYSILQPDLSQRLLKDKVRNLEAENPDTIVTANIGCLTHIQSGTKTRVQHWIELIDQELSRSNA
ncbi:MAG: glycolate oxidase subunit GlcF [Betaproteobacteria bacterium]